MAKAKFITPRYEKVYIYVAITIICSICLAPAPAKAVLFDINGEPLSIDISVSVYGDPDANLYRHEYSLTTGPTMVLDYLTISYGGRDETEEAVSVVSWSENLNDINPDVQPAYWYPDYNYFSVGWINLEIDPVGPSSTFNFSITYEGFSYNQIFGVVGSTASSPATPFTENLSLDLERPSAPIPEPMTLLLLGSGLLGMGALRQLKSRFKGLT